MIPLKRKPLPPLGAWLLTDHDGKSAMEWMFAAIADLAQFGWRGTPLPGPGGVIERIEFNHDARPLGAVQAAVGAWVVLELDGDLKVLTESECSELYDPVEEV
ncbi:hypothetical protein [Mycolicibacterium gilvum]|uniref:hypothetical protein n=1 Tax=Mycolicibacterium gilvum TaxID=1804 RepID=UPI0040457AC9